MPTFESVKFPSVTGAVLAGTVDIPDGEVRAWAVFCHGFTLGKNSAAAARISKALARHGIGVLRYDAAGLGSSTGDWSDTTFTTKVEDIRQAAAFMQSAGRPVSLLIGHSLGGAAVLGAVGALDEVKAVVTISAPYEPVHVVHLFDEAMDDVERQGVGEVTLGGKRLQIRKQLVEDLKRTDLTGCIRNLDRPLLVMHSPTDQTVGIDNAGEIFQAARHPKSFISLEGSTHLLTDRGQTDRAALLIAAWANQYLDTEDPLA
ncbi:putative redox protein [Arthrobacter crystallopoietes BAB-32]|uniref:Putative redox protein n=1 Tax=Arthrobacter crystallopoietes BAB-32 TaxID=1246476 RepID=N1URJ1_9MICC|nr:alpha/beta fold hydrolase [Arthrobacter crystallopoietes]EMY33041.1 putative redox protein [Arthrobacter crystallopoietes BAB-32]